MRQGAIVNDASETATRLPCVGSAQGHGTWSRSSYQRGDLSVRAQANDWATQISNEPRVQYRPTGGLTPLLYAARAGCLGCVQAMLEAGADKDRPNPDGMTPMMMALDNGYVDVARYLLDQGANPQTWDWWGRTALYVAVTMRGGQDAAPGAIRRVAGDEQALPDAS